MAATDWQKGGSTKPSTVSQTNALNLDTILSDFVKLSDGARMFYAKALDNAGYSVGKVTGAPNPRLIQVYLQAQGDFDTYRAASGQPNLKFEDWLTTIDVSGQGGAGGTKTRRDVTLDTPETAATLIEAVMKDTVGRGPTDDELKKYTTKLIAAQKANPQVTSYSTQGGVTNATTTPGLDEKSFLIEQISGTDEAKATKVFSFYDVFKRAIGAS
jgi:hypothetical protein